MNSATDNPMVFTGEIKNVNLLGAQDVGNDVTPDYNQGNVEDPVDPNQLESLQDAKAEIVRLRNLLAKKQSDEGSNAAMKGMQKGKNGEYTNKRVIHIIRRWWICNQRWKFPWRIPC